MEGYKSNISRVSDPDPGKGDIFPDPGSSGYEMNLKQNLSGKLIELDNFSTKCSI
jgi:hypothetical protein